MSNADVYERFETDLTRNPEFKIKTYEENTSWVRRGDLVQDGNGQWRKVRESKIGYKYVTYLDEAEDTILRVELGSKVPIKRREKTKASVKAAERLRHNVKIWDKIEAARTAVDDAIQTLQEDRPMHGVRYYHIDKIMLNWASSQLWLGVERTFENHPEEDLVKAYKRKAKWERGRILDRWGHKSVSRSTSVTSNLMEDVEMQVRIEFLDFLNRY